MTLKKLNEEIFRKQSLLCVGLDITPSSFEQVRPLIDATAPYAVAYKPNTAFYESQGAQGWRILEQVANYIKTQYPNHFLIADAKRGDIGNTARQYARAFFEHMPFDAVTLAPYMGLDSVAPFLEYKDKTAIVLALTSNPSATQFETQTLAASGQPLYSEVIAQACTWASEDQLMFVVGATRPAQLEAIRAQVPQHFLLVPGVGAQGGSMEEVITHAHGERGRLLVNVSRGIAQAPQGPQAAAKGYAQACAPYIVRSNAV